MHVLMLAMSDVRSDARVLREARTIAESGRRVTVVGRGESGELSPGVTALGVRADRGLDPGRDARVPAWVRRTARWWLLPEHRSRVEAAFRRAAADSLEGREFDVIHAHDLVTLPLATELSARTGARVVYDSHECWTGRRMHGRPAPLAVSRARRLERRLGSRADAVVTVSPGIARWFEQSYGWRHVSLVRNTFPLDTAPLAPPEGDVCGVVYAGRIGPRRDLHVVVEAASRLPELSIELLGHVDHDFARSFDPGAACLRPPIGIDEVDAVYRRAGIAAVPLADDSLNHRLALPNKVFQAVRAGVPVVAADLPELGALVRRYDLGATYTSGDVSGFVAGVRAVVDRVDHHRQQVLAAREDLSWDVDSRRLLATYDRLPTTR